ncbi:RagB/SusD family nutrient uptake outer membrane protein [Algibacter pacificus]|uniref:RagB/SusD family nutrient uptake outer membrane protein n=1 Tax=Algibacter pacificus TaxID=2599389 RepID=UPI0011C8A442|nr:RagB/SusD family nutrient uptake outer membrane protein [Algibacter pacificus]
MKTYKYLFLLIGLSMISCSDLEEEPVGLLSPTTYFTSLDKLQVAVNGAYGYMHNRFFLTRETGLTLMLRSDMVEISDPNTRQERIDHDEFTDLDDNGQTLVSWPIMYQIVAAANQAIAGAETVDADEAEINAIVAQAYFARALAYYHLVRQFGDIPYLSEPVTNVEEANNIEKTAVADVYANIIADFTFAKTWLPLTQDKRSIPSAGAASSYLASVYLTMGDYPMAYAEAKDVISKKNIYGYDLEPDFQNLFNSSVVRDSKEPIFTLDYIGDTSLGNYSTDYLVPLTGIRADNQYGSGQEGWAVTVPPLKAYTTWDDNDYRKSVSFDATGVFNGVERAYNQPPTAQELIDDADSQGGFNAVDARNKNQPYCAKYTRFRGESGGNGRASSHAYLLMRYAEVLLIAAEAANEVTPGSQEAHDWVNEVRGRARDGAAGSTPSASPADVSGLSGATFTDMVLEERRLELAFELKRWYDIARRKLGSEVFSASGLEGAKSFSEDNYLLAIPEVEQERNPNL